MMQTEQCQNPKTGSATSAGKSGISLPAADSLVITSMIGVGVFTSVGFQLLGLPSAFPILLLWVVGGVVSLCGALCYAELVAMIPRSGGEYHLLREAYHPMVGFLAGWISMTAGFAAPISSISMVFGKYLHSLGMPFASKLMAGGLILIIAAVYLGNLRLGGRFLTATTSLKVTLILAFLAGAVFLSQGQSASLAPKAGDALLVASPGFANSLVYVMFAYLGWNGAAYVAGEVKNPQRTVPLAFILGIVIVMALYVALNAVFLWRAPWAEMQGKEEAGLIAAKAIFGRTGGWWMGALIAFGTVSTVAGFTLAGSRVSQRIGQDFAGVGFLGRVNRFGAPWVAVLVQTVIALLMLFSGTFDQVTNYMMSQLTLCSMLAVLAVIVMRWRLPRAERPFRVPLYPLPALIFLGMSSWMLVFWVRARPAESALGLLTLVAGTVFYLLITAASNLRSGRGLCARD
jgi:APA family basic amino acid/polyamine antiporter